MQRESWIDDYRGLLIIFVVMGHVIGGAFHLTQGAVQPFLHYCFLVIYSFHMPAFFFLAGILWHLREDEGLGAFALRKARRLIVPYFVFGLLSSIVFCLMSGSIGSSVDSAATTSYYTGKCSATFGKCLLGLLQGGGLADGEGFRMNSVLWFLPCMFSVSIFYWILSKLRLTGLRAIPVVLVCMVCAMAFTKLSVKLPWGFSRAPNFLIYMILGAECCPRGGFPVFTSRKPLMVVVVGVLTLAFVGLVCLLPDPYVIGMNIAWWPVYAAVASVGCILSACWAQLLPCRGLAVCGTASMGIMLMHKFPVVFLELKVRLVREILGMGIVGALVGSMAVTVVVVFACILANKVVKRKAPWALGERA